MTSWPTLLGDSGGHGCSDDADSGYGDAAGNADPGRAGGRAHTRDTVLQQFNNPTAQQMAEKNFNQRPAADPEMAEMNGATMSQAGDTRTGLRWCERERDEGRDSAGRRTSRRLHWIRWQGCCWVRRTSRRDKKDSRQLVSKFRFRSVESGLYALIPGKFCSWETLCRNASL